MECKFFYLYIYTHDRKYRYTWVQYVWHHVRFVAVTYPFNSFFSQSTHDFEFMRLILRVNFLSFVFTFTLGSYEDNVLLVDTLLHFKRPYSLRMLKGFYMRFLRKNIHISYNIYDVLKESLLLFWKSIFCVLHIFIYYFNDNIKMFNLW